MPSGYSLRGRLEDPAEITYRLDFENAPLDHGSIEELFARACAEWSAVAPVGFRPAAEGDGAGVTVSFERATHGRCRPFGIDTAVAHTGPIGAQTYIHIDHGRAWKRDGLREGQFIPLYQTFLHELGHVLGLGHSPDPAALMSTNPQTERVERSDRDGVRTLYGGGRPGPNDYRVRPDDPEGAVLYGLRVEGTTEGGFFDTDGDGTDELLLWRMDGPGFGQLVAFFFDRRGRPLRTMGPRFGFVDGTAEISFAVTDEKERFLILTYPNGHRIGYVFDGQGAPSSFTGELPAPNRTSHRRLEGDLDGDDRDESVLH